MQARDRLVVSPSLLITVRHDGAGICRPDEAPTIPVAFAGLRVLQQLAAGQAPTLDAAEGELVDRLRSEGLLLPAGEEGDVPGEDAAPTPAGDAPELGDAIATATPIVLRPGPGGFDALDHEGRLRARLDVTELAAFVSLAVTGSRDKALERHQEEAGDAALTGEELDALIRRLAGVRLVGPADEANPAGREDQDAKRIRGHWTRMGRAADRAVAAHDEEERAREAGTGIRRTKVIPVDRGQPMPLALGMIVAHAKAWAGGRLEEHYQFVPAWFTRLRQPLVDPEQPAIYLYSNYVWQHRRNLETSELIKSLAPSSINIHGGPDTPKYERDVETYLRGNPHVDIAVHGEGELTMAEALDALAPSLSAGRVDLSVLRDVPGLSFRLGDEVVHTGERDRITELDVVPSPFLMGLFDPHAEAVVNMAILETNRGCPYGCTFCDWGSATQSRIRKFDMDRVFAELEWCAINKVRQVFLADANFGIFERDVEIAEKVAELKVRHGYPRLLSTNYAKNTTKHVRKIVQSLADAGILTQGLLSLQSMDAETLKTVRRSNIKVEKYDDLAREFRSARLPLFVDLMLGLPGATPASFAADLQGCIDREVTAKIYPTELLVNSPMNEAAYREEHQIQTVAPLSELVKTAQSPDGAVKRSLVISTSSFSKDDYAEMLHLRRVFLISENFGVLRHVARFVRQEAGVAEVDLYQRLRVDARARPDRWPLLDFAFRVLPFVGTAPVSWRLFIDEVRNYLTTQVGIAEGSALETVLAVQHALLPAPDRAFPLSLELRHDFAAWAHAIVDSKDAGVADWTAAVPHLADLGPATFTVDDPNEVCTKGVGFKLDDNLHAAWELESPVGRAVSHEHLARV
jgi:hypothetical protein